MVSISTNISRSYVLSLACASVFYLPRSTLRVCLIRPPFAGLRGDRKGLLSSTTILNYTQLFICVFIGLYDWDASGGPSGGGAPDRAPPIGYSKDIGLSGNVSGRAAGILSNAPFGLLSIEELPFLVCQFLAYFCF